MKLHSIYYPRKRLVAPTKPNRYEEHCKWIGGPDPLPTNVRKFVKRAR